MVIGVLIPYLIEIAIVIFASLVITFIGFLLVRKKFSHERLSENHTVASYIFNAFSITYGVLLAFAVYANWYNYEQAEGNVTNETAYLSNFFRDTRILPDSIKNVVTQKLIAYTKAIIDDEFDKLSQGTISHVAELALDDLWNTYTKIPLSVIPNTYLYNISLERLNLISQYRRKRILDMEQTIPTVVWIVLISCALISIGYSYFFTTKKRGTHLSLIATFIIINVLLFYLIYVLDHPYSGYDRISYEPFKLVLEKFLR
jgi:hypothetical protein